VLVLEGALDIATTTEAHKRLIGLDLPRRGRLVLDLREVTFMDSTGIRLLLRAREHARRCGAEFGIVPGPADVMRVLVESPPVLRMLDLTGAARLLPIDLPTAA